MKGLKPYEKYKSSGIEWLGEIPEHWEVKRIKYIFKEQDKRSEEGLEDLLSVSHYTGVTKKSDRYKSGEEISNAKTLVGYKIVTEGDLVMNIMLAWNGSLGISKFNGITSPAYCVYKSLIGGERFFGYLFRTKNAQQEFKKQSTGIIESRLRLYPDKFFNIKTVIPESEEQTAIANFLDYKTTKIDRFIRKKKQLIKLLNEQKVGIINDAVTKGLDTNEKMKSSGIEWLGDIPEHWEVKKLKYLGKFQNGISASAEYFGTGFPFVSYGDIYKNFELSTTGSGLANSSIQDQTNYSVKKGDVFFTRTSETIEEIGLTSTCLNTIENATFSGFIIRFRPFVNILFDGFSKYYFRSSLHRRFFVKEMNLVTRASLSQELLKRLPVIIPPFEEQILISNHIETETAKLNKAISTIEKEIALVQEYKTALIAEAVTGKIDVGDYVIPVIEEETEIEEEGEEELDLVEDGEIEI